MTGKIRVLVIDDSALVREILTKGLSLDPAIEVVGTAADPYQARDRIVELAPDVLTLDVEMPRMDGVQFLRKLMPQYPMRVVMVSTMTQKGKQVTIDALEAGAVDFVSKPTTNVVSGLQAMLGELRAKIKVAAKANVAHWKNKKIVDPSSQVLWYKPLAETTDKVVAIGASTGGTEAIARVVSRLPVTMPGVVIVQHMPPGFTTMYAERLNKISELEVREAESGDRVRSGLVLLAPGAKQMRVQRTGGIYMVTCEPGEKVSGHCPSVDVLMHSVADHAGANAIGVMLTGMGSDGAQGMLAMRKSGARNIAQDEASSVVFGMPRVAYEKGGAEALLPLEDIAGRIVSLLTEMGHG